jgi:hypothetical protein
LNSPDQFGGSLRKPRKIMLSISAPQNLSKLNGPDQFGGSLRKQRKIVLSNIRTENLTELRDPMLTKITCAKTFPPPKSESFRAVVDGEEGPE